MTDVFCFSEEDLRQLVTVVGANSTASGAALSSTLSAKEPISHYLRSTITNVCASPSRFVRRSPEELYSAFVYALALGFTLCRALPALPPNHYFESVGHAEVESLENFLRQSSVAY